MINQKGRTFSKWQTFSLTFLAYASLHSMRMAYAQIKPEFKEAFHQSHLFLGLFDAAIYLSLGVGFLTRFYFSTKKHLIDVYFIFMSIASAAYLYIPLSSIFLGDRVQGSFLLKEVLPGVSLLVFGFCQFPAWPTLLTIINRHFIVEKQGDITGAWSACGDIGNIIGLGLSGIFVTICRCKWEYLMIIAAVLNWAASLLIYLKIDEDWEQTKATQVLERSAQLTQAQEFWMFSRAIIVRQENKLYLVAMGLLKSILYGFLLWIPSYLTQNNFAHYKSTVPIFFNIGALVGSFILGSFYNTSNSSQADQSDSISRLFNHMKLYSLFYSCLAVTAIFTIFYAIKVTILVYFLLSTLCGAFLGGCFNMLASNEVLALVKGHKEDVNRLSTLSMAVGNLMVGVVEIVIGVVLNVNGKANGQNMLFVILMTIGIFSMAALLRRTSIVSRQGYYEAQQTKELQNVIVK